MWCTVWKFANFSPTIFLKKFRQINVFTKKLYCESIWRKNFAVGENFRNYHTVTSSHCGNYRIFLSQWKISSNEFFSNFFSKMLLSRNFCQKCVRVNFRNFLTVFTEKERNLLSPLKTFREVNQNTKIDFTEFFLKHCYNNLWRKNYEFRFFQQGKIRCTHVPSCIFSFTQENWKIQHAGRHSFILFIFFTRLCPLIFLGLFLYLASGLYCQGPS